MQMVRVSRCHILVAAAVLVGACSSSVPIPDGAQLTCAAASDCPSGFICHNAMCERIGAFDTTPPNLESLAVSPAAPWDASTGFGNAATTFTMDLTADKPLSEPPKVTIETLPPVDVTCAGTGGNGYRCTYQPTGLENGGYGGVVKLDVWLKDLSRNENTLSGVGALDLDFAPPAVAAASVAYYPDPSNPLPAVQRATAGTVVHVALTADELLNTTTASLSLSVNFGSGPLAFDPVPGSTTAIGAAFELTVPAVPLPADGTYTPSVTWTDLAGNTVTTSAGMPAIVVKTSAPVLTVNQSAVVFVRSPWGNAAPEDLGGYTIPAGPYFALDPSDVFSTSTHLPAGTFMLAGGATPSEVLVKASDQSGALLLGALRPNADHTWPRQALSSPDLPTVYVVGLDDAGNESSAVKIESAEWVATPNPPPFGTNPNTLERVGTVSHTRKQETDVHPADQTSSVSTAGADGDAILVQREAAWRKRDSNGDAPLERYDHAMAYDHARGRVVLFGGESRGLYLQDTWEWDGNNWTQVATTGPGPRDQHAMAYDSARGRVVLFGGWDGLQSRPLGDTWEWDGQSWMQVASESESGPRGMCTMAYDSARAQTVMFCGGDTWLWDGSSWTWAENSNSPLVDGTAMAYDSAREEAILWDSRSSCTWRWNGLAWDQVASTGPTSYYNDGAMVYDEARGRVLLSVDRYDYNVWDLVRDTWEWDGSTNLWTLIASSLPMGRSASAMAYDISRSRTVLFGGLNRDYLHDTWEWDGTRWTQAAQPGPASRFQHAVAYDSERGVVVLFGGRNCDQVAYGECAHEFGDTWEWDGTSWAQKANSGPSARYGHAMAYDSTRHRVVLYGGQDSNGLKSDTWEWDGTSWTQKAASGPAGSLMAYSSLGQVILCGSKTWRWNGSTWTQVASTGSPVNAAAIAYDSARGRVVLFGQGYYCWGGGTWEFDGQTWSMATNSGPTDICFGHAMAYDTTRGRVVLFGGAAGNPPSADAWDWDGNTWRAMPATSAPKPGGRVGHAMAYDSARHQVFLFGGAPDSSFYGPSLGDTWEQRSELREPAIQFDASERGITRSSITALRVRAYAGGTGDASSIGAYLFGWSNGYGTNAGPGAWVPLLANSTGIAAEQPYLPAPPASLIEWRTSSADEARQYLTERDGQLSFQVRSSGSSGPNVDGAQVALDYIEVRVRYTAP